LKALLARDVGPQELLDDVGHRHRLERELLCFLGGSVAGVRRSGLEALRRERELDVDDPLVAV
jgi:hypothetical protein